VLAAFVNGQPAGMAGFYRSPEEKTRHKGHVWGGFLHGDKSSGRVNRARVFWEEIGAYDRVAFGTEIAASRVLMGNGEELENRGVTPDEFCVPTPADLRAEKDHSLERALTLARSATAVSQAAAGNSN
jgi:C-terminal processing protease CtpA/Prc